MCLDIYLYVYMYVCLARPARLTLLASLNSVRVIAP